jgi:hypothetical protein
MDDILKSVRDEFSQKAPGSPLPAEINDGLASLFRTKSV